MVDAAAMAKGLGETGHIALYGIYFDTDKAVVKPESRPTLEQIAKLLTGQPQLNVFIVGHTDNQGAYEYNLDLSRRRAEAVAAELVKNFRIVPARLRAAGVGFLAPVGSNANEGGRALNRRVELVAPLRGGIMIRIGDVDPAAALLPTASTGGIIIGFQSRRHFAFRHASPVTGASI